MLLPDPHVLLQNEPNKKVLLLGNESIARGILEAGIGIVTTYPGTPASEIGDTIAHIASKAGMYMEYSTNEIVAVEVAAGAANAGARALTAMKHVGLNVAADAVMTLAYIGVKGGYIIVTADDPECYSSQNEQDNRFYSLISNLPCLEPSDPQEAKDMTLNAIEISEKLELPVLLRTTTRINHTRAPVVYGKILKPHLNGAFLREPQRLVMVPAHARLMHGKLLEKTELGKAISEESKFNRVTKKGKSKLGIISSGSAYNYASEAEDLLNLDSSILKLGMTHPLPEKLITRFLNSNEKVIIVEELEPYLELQIKAIAKDHAPETTIFGKLNTGFLSRKGELSTQSVAEGISKITNKKLPLNTGKATQDYSQISGDLPGRPPVLCAGCPHRASFLIMKRAGGEAAIYSTDIGCYALGAAPPLGIGDILICMGSGVSTAQGLGRVTGRTSIAAVGDSTFFHGAIPGLINAVYNNAKVTLAILDNMTTAMTGHQPHPGTGITAMGVFSQSIKPEKIARACGVKFVRVVNPFRAKEAEKTFREALQQEGPSVVVFRAPCALADVREKRQKGISLELPGVSTKCTGCMTCIKLLGCPALIVEGEKVQVDEKLCTACGLCVTVCPFHAIKKKAART